MNKRTYSKPETLTVLLAAHRALLAASPEIEDDSLLNNVAVDFNSEGNQENAEAKGDASFGDFWDGAW